MLPNDRIFPAAHSSHYHYASSSQHPPLPAPTSLLPPNQPSGTPTTATTATTSSTDGLPFHSLPQPIQQPRQPPNYPPLARPPPPPPPPQTIAGLSSFILTHPFLPLCMQKLLSLLDAPSLDLPPQLLTHFSESENNFRILNSFANTHGLSRAYERWSPTDVFLASFLVALDDAKAGLQATVPFQNLPLQHTVSVAKDAIAAKSPVPNGLKLQKSIVKAADPKVRTPLTEAAKAMLEKWFKDNLENPYPTMEDKEKLADACGMTLSSVNNWFGNKRMRIKRKMLNVAGQGTPSSSGDNDGIGDRVLAPRSKWNAVVVSKLNSERGRAVVANATGRVAEADNTANAGESSEIGVTNP